jgi:hypothetical protein
MKINDILICKTQCDNPVITKYKEYKIIDKGIFFCSYLNRNTEYITIYNDFGRSCNYILCGDNSRRSVNYWFTSKPELRIKKLNKIC